MDTLPNGWSEQNGHLIFALKCRDFKHAVAVLNTVADIANRLNHHPDIGIRNYNEVFVSTTTHDVDGVSYKDYKLANEITDLLEFEAEKLHIEKYGRNLID